MTTRDPPAPPPKPTSAWADQIQTVIVQEYGRFRRKAWLCGCRDEMLDEVVSETVLGCLNALEDYNEQRGSLGGWISGRIPWVALNHKRKAQRNRSPELLVEQPETLATEGAESEHGAAQLEVDQVLRELLGELPEEQADAWVLNKIERMPLTEVARELGAPVPTVTSRVRLAGEKLRALYEERYSRSHAALPIMAAGATGSGAFEQWLRRIEERARTVGEAPAEVRERLRDRVREEILKRAHTPSSPPRGPSSAAPHARSWGARRGPWVDRAFTMIVTVAAVEALHRGFDRSEHTPVTVATAIGREIVMQAPARGLSSPGTDVAPRFEAVAQTAPTPAPVAPRRDAMERPHAEPPAVPAPTAARAVIASEEDSLIELAQAHLREGPQGAPAALEAIARHRANFPGSSRAQHLDSLEIRAFALLGRTGEAQTRAERFRQAHPHSSYLASINQAISQAQ